MPTLQDKISKLFRAKENPGLAVVEAIQELEAKVAEIEQEAKLIVTKQAERAISEAILGLKDELSSLAEKAVQERIFTGISQIKGEKGNTPEKGKDYWTESEINEIVSKIQSQIRIPSDGKPGDNGKTPVASIDYPTKEQVKTQIKFFVSQIKIPEPVNGITPIKGKDYFTEADIKSIVRQVEELLSPTLIKQKLESLQGEERLDAKAIKNLPKFMGEERKTLHRGGISLEWEIPTGTLDGANTSFTLSSPPYTSSTVMIFVNGVLQKSGDGNDYTISGKTITTITAPPSGSVIWAFYRKA